MVSTTGHPDKAEDPGRCLDTIICLYSSVAISAASTCLRHSGLLAPMCVVLRTTPSLKPASIITAAAPHLAPGEYGDVLRRLKVVITKDSNVVCVAEAICCVGALAKVRWRTPSLQLLACRPPFYLLIMRRLLPC